MSVAALLDDLPFLVVAATTMVVGLIAIGAWRLLDAATAARKVGTPSEPTAATGEPTNTLGPADGSTSA